MDGGFAGPSSYGSEEVLDRHGSDGARVSANSLLFRVFGRDEKMPTAEGVREKKFFWLEFSTKTQLRDTVKL